MKMKKIGVLGGLGPQATMDFEVRFHRACQARIPPRQNGGYPPMQVHYHRAPPMDVDADSKPIVPLRASPALLAAARRLGAWADLLVIPSNTPHLFQSEIEDAAGRPVVSMLDAVVADVERRGWRTVGVLEAGRPRIYPPLLAARGIEHEIAGSEARAALHDAIFLVMEGRDDEPARAVAAAAVAELRGKGVEGIILGCTEIPLLLPGAADAADLIDPVHLLADAAVRAALV